MAEGDDERDLLSAGPWATTTTTSSTDRQARPPLSSSSTMTAGQGEDAGVARALSFIEPGQRHHGDHTRSSLHDQQRPGRPPGALDAASRTRSLYVPAPSPSRSRSHASSLRSGGGARPTSSLLDSLPRPKPMRSASSVGAPTVAAMVDDDEEERMQTWRATAHGDTPLDRTIDAIGMGKYQWALLVLTGCGWAADNMWLQGVAIVLPRVQSTFAITDTSIGLVSSSTFAGMMLGALAWGAYSDTYGRRGAFNGTLSLVAGFGTLAAFAPSFGILCILLFGLGLGLGGSMPTDGTVFLENLPVRKQYLLTALSVFFSAGSVASALIALIVLSPTTSSSPTSSPSSWRIFLGLLALVTAFFVALRLVFFPLLESPRFLVSTGKREEARVALQKIADYNSAPMPVALSDVSDRRSAMLGGQGGGRDGEDGDEEDDDDDEGQSGAAGGRMRRAGGYTSLPNSATSTDSAATIRPRSTRSTSAAAAAPPASTSTWTDTLSTLRAKYDTLLNDSWRRTTLLVWAIWITVNLAFTMFNVFLPKLLAERSGSGSVTAQQDEDSSSSSALLSYLLYSLLSLPGPLLSSYLIQLPPPLFGRRGTLCLSLLSTSACVFLFFSSTALTTLSTMAVSLAASTAYAALYGYTPEVFSEASLRGTAAGTASALGRLAGIVAPLVAGRLLAATGATVTTTMIETEGGGEVVVGVQGGGGQGGGGGHSMLGWTCTILFLIAAGCAAALPIETWTDSTAAGQEEDDDEEGEQPS